MYEITYIWYIQTVTASRPGCWEFSRNILEDWLIMVITVPATELVLLISTYEFKTGSVVYV